MMPINSPPRLIPPTMLRLHTKTKKRAIGNRVVFDIDTENKVVNITTDHLSTYAVFTYSKERTRRTTVALNSLAPYQLKSADKSLYTTVLKDIIDNKGQPTDITLKQGFEITNEALGISGNALTTVTEAMYVTKSLSSLGNMFTAVGVAAALVQAAYDWEKQDDGLDLKTNLTKNMSYLGVSIWGSSAAKLCSVGVFCIDYSLNEFGKQAWSQRNEVYQRAYSMYYGDKYPGNKLPKKLYSLIYDAYSKTRNNPGSFNLVEETKSIVHNFAGEFWRDEISLPEYLQKVGIKFSGLGGFNDNTIKETTESFYVELMQTTMQPIFKRISGLIVYDLQQDYLRKLAKIRDEFNRKINVNIFETKANEADEYKYAEHYVRFSPLEEGTDLNNWTGKLKKDATAKTYFTLIGYLQSGAPKNLDIYAPNANLETDEPIETIPLKIDLGAKELNIDVGSKPPTLDELVGTWTSDANKFTLLNADADWDKLKKFIADGSEQAMKEIQEEYGCDDTGFEASPETIDTIKLGLDTKIGSTQYIKFSIEKVDETHGKLTFVSFPNSSEGECDSVTGLSFLFSYKDGKAAIDYKSMFNGINTLMSKSGDGSELPLSSYIPGQGGLTAKFGVSDSREKVIILSGNIDYSIALEDESFSFKIYINYGLYGEK